MPTDAAPGPSPLKVELRAALEEPRAEALAGRGGVALARTVAAVYDGLLVRRFEEADAAWRAGTGAGRVALVAVGGWGRAALGFGSDLDLVVLTDGARDAEALAESLLYPLWDAGVSLGHAVRTRREFVQLGRADLRSATMMLDGRFLAGDRALAEESLAEGRRAMFDGDLRAFLRALETEMAERHARFGATVYLLEPDLKHGRGGLRDLDIARWALAARFRAGDFREALRAGALRAVECDALEECLEATWRIRLFVHARRGRRVDRLTFDEQEEAARVLVPIDPALAAEDEDRALGLAVETMMSGWYHRAREVATVIEHLLPRCRPARSDTPHPHRAHGLAPGVVRFDGTACFAAPELLARDPAAALRIVEVAVAHGVPLGESSRASIAAAARDPAWCARFGSTPRRARAFCGCSPTRGARRLRTSRTEAVSATPDNPESLLAELHDLGLLLAMIPEFAAVTSKVQHDVYHVYTVDVHSVAAVDRLHALARGELGEDFALATKLLPDTDRRDVLCLATLLHDVGKARGDSTPRWGLRWRPTSRDASASARTTPPPWPGSWPKHLTLYHVATRRDLADPVTVRARTRHRRRDPWRLRRPVSPHRRRPLHHVAHRDEHRGSRACSPTCTARLGGPGRRAEEGPARGPGGAMRRARCGGQGGRCRAVCGADAPALPPGDAPRAPSCTSCARLRRDGARSADVHLSPLTGERYPRGGARAGPRPSGAALRSWRRCSTRTARRAARGDPQPRRELALDVFVVRLPPGPRRATPRVARDAHAAAARRAPAGGVIAPRTAESP
jgi:[protein-PII] uridylyltransferase